MSDANTDKILQQRALDPQADTVDIARAVSIALGREITEAEVYRVLSEVRQQTRNAGLERIRAQQQQAKLRSRANLQALRLSVGRSADGMR